MEVKLRKIVTGKAQTTFGLTVPNDIAIFFSGCYFDVSREHDSIVFKSGTSINPSKEEIESYKFNECRV